MADPKPVPIEGLFETHLSVSDLDRSVEFYRRVVGLDVWFEVPERRACFFWVGPPGTSMLALWEIGTSPVSLHLHLAFKVAIEDLLEAPARLRAFGLTPLSFALEETDEPTIGGSPPNASIFFRDPDGHSLEYIALLEGPGVTDPVPYSEWAFAR
jgi:lactoylglutathione lyase